MGGGGRRRAPVRVVPPAHRMPPARPISRKYDTRGGAGVALPVDGARRIGRAYAEYVRERGANAAGKPVAVGRDNRPSGESLQPALVEGLTAGGFDVIDLGVIPTPVAYWSAHNLDVVGAIQVTGSHNPREYNGFKLGLGKGSIWGAEIQTLHDIAGREHAAARRRGTVTRHDA